MIQVIETAPNQYRVPAVDNRSRGAYKTCSIVTSLIDYAAGEIAIDAERVRLDGTIERVQYSGMGVTNLDELRENMRVLAADEGKTLLDEITAVQAAAAKTGNEVLLAALISVKSAVLGLDD